MATPEVVRGIGGETLAGVVFEDSHGDGRHPPAEPGIAGGRACNGLDVVRADAGGSYRRRYATAFAPSPRTVEAGSAETGKAAGGRVA